MGSRWSRFIDRNWFAVAFLAVVVTVVLARWTSTSLPDMEDETPGLIDRVAARQMGLIDTPGGPGGLPVP